MYSDHKYFLVIDFEATCCDSGSVPRDEMEIIEFGALIQNTSTFEVESEFQSFIRPIRHKELTSFCKQLTTITQDDVNNAPTFPSVIESLLDWLKPYEDYVFCSWGNYDRKQLEQDCAFHEIEPPLGHEHINVKAQFSSAMGTKKQMGISGALKRLNLSFQGTPHRGIDDVRNIARIIQTVRAGG